MSGRMWKTVGASAGKIGMGETKEEEAKEEAGKEREERDKKRKQKKGKIMEVKKVAKEWKIWNKEEEASKVGSRG